MIRLAQYQPEIPQNTGTLMRLGACLNMGLDIIHPCGFLWEDRYLRRAGMDYQDKAIVKHHTNWETFLDWASAGSYRLVLLDTQAQIPYVDFSFQFHDILLLGQESSGMPQEIYNAVSNRVKIPMLLSCRSLNVSIAAAMVMGEGLRQLNLFPAGKV